MSSNSSQKLTAKQRLALDRIIQSIASRGYPPTVRELVRVLGFRSTQAVARHLDALERKGYIRRAGGARAISITRGTEKEPPDRMEIHLGERGLEALTARLPGFRPRQREIYRQLLTRAPELANVYFTAVRVLAADFGPARVYLVAHAVRDIANRLPDYLDVPIPKDRVDYPHRLDRVARRWRTIPSIASTGAATPASQAPAQVPLPLDLFREISLLVNDHLAAKVTHRERAQGVFLALDEGGNPTQAHLVSRAEQWRHVVDWFITHTHVRNPGERHPSTEVRECQKRFKIFEDILHSSLTPFFVPMEELDEILEDANS